MTKEKLEKIKKRILEDKKLPLRELATNLVFGKGNPSADIVFCGEAPGNQEDLQGEPFVGAAGKQLNKLLHSIGLGLEDVYICNILKYRPPNNRNPLPDEMKSHTPYLIEQINAIKPKVICTLGNFATKFVLAKFDVDGMKKIGGISFLHGNLVNIEINGIELKVIPLYHPAAMLYRPSLREELEKDFQTVKEIIL